MDGTATKDGGTEAAASKKPPSRFTSLSRRRQAPLPGANRKSTQEILELFRSNAAVQDANPDDSDESKKEQEKREAELVEQADNVGDQATTAEVDGGDSSDDSETVTGENMPFPDDEADTESCTDAEEDSQNLANQGGKCKVPQRKLQKRTKYVGPCPGKNDDAAAPEMELGMDARAHADDAQQNNHNERLNQHDETNGMVDAINIQTLTVDVDPVSPTNKAERHCPESASTNANALITLPVVSTQGQTYEAPSIPSHSNVNAAEQQSSGIESRVLETLPDIASRSVDVGRNQDTHGNDVPVETARSSRPSPLDLPIVAVSLTRCDSNEDESSLARIALHEQTSDTDYESDEASPQSDQDEAEDGQTEQVDEEGSQEEDDEDEQEIAGFVGKDYGLTKERSENAMCMRGTPRKRKIKTRLETYGTFWYRGNKEVWVCNVCHIIIGIKNTARSHAGRCKGEDRKIPCPVTKCQLKNLRFKSKRALKAHKMTLHDKSRRGEKSARQVGTRQTRAVTKEPLAGPSKTASARKGLRYQPKSPKV